MTNTQTTRLTVLRKRLAMYMEAEEAILTGQEYRIGTRSLRRPDLRLVQDNIKDLEKEIAQLEGRGKRAAFRVVPRDI